LTYFKKYLNIIQTGKIMLNWVRARLAKGQSFSKSVSNAEEIKKHSAGIADLATSLMSPKKILKNAKVETFEAAQNRLMVTEGEILQVYKNYVISFYISFFCACVCFVGFLYYAFFMTSIIPALSMMAIFTLCIINAFRFSFRAFQIKHKKLCSVNEWWESASDWFPKM